MAEEDVELVLGEAREGVQKSVDRLHHEFAKVRTGRANPAILEGIVVEYYGTPTPIKQLATLSAPEARLLTITPFDPTAIQEIHKAIHKADLGLTPSDDGKVVRVPIPEMTEERRKDLVKQIKKVAEEHKVGVRGARRDAIAMLKDLQKEGTVTEDESKRGQKKIQDVTDAGTSEIDKSVVVKEEEILRI